MSFEGSRLIDWAAFAEMRAALGADFIRILGYFREDGIKSVAAIEAAGRTQSAAAMVLPAHTLKGEAEQFGAVPLAMLAERIELGARDCLERREPATGLVDHIVRLGPLFAETLRLLEREANPLAERRPAAAARPPIPRGFDL